MERKKEKRCKKKEKIVLGCNTLSVPTVMKLLFLTKRSFSVLKNDFYTRELLASWTYEVCDRCSTFPDKFDLWFEWSQKIVSSMIYLGSARVLGRIQAKYAFCLFPKSMTFVQLIITGEKRLNFIVMDGTAVGILDVLREFQRKSEVREAF